MLSAPGLMGITYNSSGYEQRFGLVYMDYEKQQRILKDSALWYRDIIGSNGSKV